MRQSALIDPGPPHGGLPARRAAAPDFLKPSFDALTEVVRLYPGLQAMDGEREILRGISTVDLTGHTPGHIGVRVEDAGRALALRAGELATFPPGGRRSSRT